MVRRYPKQLHKILQGVPGMVEAFFKIGKSRTFGKVLKENPITTLVKFDPFEFSREEIIELMAHGFSFNKYKLELEEKGIDRAGIIKRHNIKHDVIFVGKDTDDRQK